MTVVSALISQISQYLRILNSIVVKRIICILIIAGNGNETIVPSSKMGLTMPPFAESKPFRLSIIFIPHAPSKLWSKANSASLISKMSYFFCLMKYSIMTSNLLLALRA